LTDFHIAMKKCINFSKGDFETKFDKLKKEISSSFPDRGIRTFFNLLCLSDNKLCAAVFPNFLESSSLYGFSNLSSIPTKKHLCSFIALQLH